MTDQNGPPTRVKGRTPHHQDRPSTNRFGSQHTAYTRTSHASAHRRQDGYTAPTAEDRREAVLLAAAAEMGFRLSVQCLDCGHWLVAAKSVAAHRGPRCRARAAI
jgi:hypothetical protein